MKLPVLNDVIEALECEGIWRGQCATCPYNYQYWDDSGDNGFWSCDEEHIKKDATFFLRLYKLLINEEQNE